MINNDKVNKKYIFTEINESFHINTNFVVFAYKDFLVRLEPLCSLVKAFADI